MSRAQRWPNPPKEHKTDPIPGLCPECAGGLSCAFRMGDPVVEEFLECSHGSCPECGGVLYCRGCAVRKHSESERGEPLPRNLEEALCQGFEIVGETLDGLSAGSGWCTGYIELVRGKETLRIPIGAELIFYRPNLVRQAKEEKAPLSDTVFLKKIGIKPARLRRTAKNESNK